MRASQYIRGKLYVLIIICFWRCTVYRDVRGVGVCLVHKYKLWNGRNRMMGKTIQMFSRVYVYWSPKKINACFYMYIISQGWRILAVYTSYIYYANTRELVLGEKKNRFCLVAIRKQFSSQLFWACLFPCCLDLPPWLSSGSIIINYIWFTFFFETNILCILYVLY